MSDEAPNDATDTPAWASPAPTPMTRPQTANRCGVHPGVHATFTCSRCGTYGCDECLESTRPMPLCVACAARGVNAPAWERRRELGWTTAFLETSKEACFSPSKFFARRTTEGFLGGGGYGVLAYTFGQVVLMLQMVLVFGVFFGIGASAAQTNGAETGALLGVGAMWVCMVVPMTLVSAPMYALFGIAFALIGAHLPLMAMKRDKATFEETGAAVSYANAGYLWYAVPCVGALIAPFYVMALEVIAIRETHEVSTGLALIAVLFWRLAIIGVFVLFYAAMIAFMFNAASSV